MIMSFFCLSVSVYFIVIDHHPIHHCLQKIFAIKQQQNDDNNNNNNNVCFIKMGERIK